MVCPPQVKDKCVRRLWLLRGHRENMLDLDVLFNSSDS